MTLSVDGYRLRETFAMAGIEFTPDELEAKLRKGIEKLGNTHRRRFLQSFKPEKESKK